MSWIKEVRLENFMSYDYARIPLKKGLNLIVGPNGSGKSSILLAISIAFGQIYTERSKKLSGLIKWGRDVARVSLIIDNSRVNGRRPFGFSSSDSIIVSRYIKQDGSYWYEIDYRGASLYEVQNIFRRIGINPNNMLIIMHQNTLERFSSLKAEEKLYLLQDAVGLGAYRNRIEDSRRKLESLDGELNRIEGEFSGAKETLSYWKQMHETLMRRRSMELNISDLTLELAWARVTREGRDLKKLEIEGESKKEKLRRLTGRIKELSKTAINERGSVTKNPELLDHYTRIKIELALKVFKKSIIRKEIKRLGEEIRQKIGKIEFMTPDGAKVESGRTTKEMEDGLEKLKKEKNTIGVIPEKTEEIYADYSKEFGIVEERKKELENNSRKTLGELGERKKILREKIIELVKTVEPRYRGILAELDGNGHLELHCDSGNVDEWGIEIYVGFKENEPKILDPMTHSGGERAAATMAFLLALQQHIRSKLRAVDEFDVHMDMYNRERVYRTIIKSVNEDEQYLVITPGQISVLDESVNLIVVQNVSGHSKPAMRA